jgi:NAD-dependent deacetylase
VEASLQGIPTVEINPGETAVSHCVDHKVAAGAADSLSRLWRQYRKDYL